MNENSQKKQAAARLPRQLPCVKCGAPAEKHHSEGYCHDCYEGEVARREKEAAELSRSLHRSEAEKRKSSWPLVAVTKSEQQREVDERLSSPVRKLRAINARRDAESQKKKQQQINNDNSSSAAKVKKPRFSYDNDYLSLLVDCQVNHNVSLRQAGPLMSTIIESGYFGQKNTKKFTAASKETASTALITNGVACDFMIAVLLSETPGLIDLAIYLILTLTVLTKRRSDRLFGWDVQIRRSRTD